MRNGTTTTSAPRSQQASPGVARRPGREGGDAAGGRLVGRGAERARLDRLVGDARGGRGGVLVISGDAGAGKTALLDHVRRAASGCAVTSLTAVRSERDLEYAALHQLCRPLLGRIDHLPPPQRAALQTALGLAAGVPSERLFLGLAVLGLLADAARERPLVCLVDDAEWLDAASSSVLGFVARRLTDERVALVFGAREPGPDLARLDRVDLPGLADAEARALLASSLRTPLDRRIRDRLVAEADGNPGALLAIARGTAPAGLAGGFGEPGATAVASPIEAGHLRRLEALPRQTRMLLLSAAAEPLGEPLLLWRAAERLGIPATAADDAAEARMLEVGTQVRFRNPLLRTAVYASATPEDRRAVHRALADATDAQVDPERRAWHRACSVSAPDEAIAAELERCAGRAATRGGAVATAALLRRAAALTPEAPARARRALDAAEATWRAGDPDAALQALAIAEAVPLDALGAARAEHLRARLAFHRGAADAAARFHRAARRLGEVDVDRARAAHLGALGAIVALGSGAGADPVAIARDALAAPRAGTPRPLDLLLDGLALQQTADPAAADPALRAALAAFADPCLPAEDALGWGWLAAHVAAARWDHAAHAAITERLSQLSRQDGAAVALPHTLAHRIGSCLSGGDLRQAEALLCELDETEPGTGVERSASLARLVAAYRGREEEAHPAGDPEDRPGAEPRGVAAACDQLAGLVRHNGLGRYEDALRAGRGALDDPQPIGAPAWALPELVEAASRAGAAQDAAAALDRLGEAARRSATDWALGLEARSRALVSEGDEAEPLFREAIERLARAGRRVDLARARLLFGEWLRRAGRRADARAELRVAHDELADMGLEAFAERARRELRATGATARRRSSETRDDLTAQELEIARLARDGLSNPQIGAQLFLSARTVEWHLRKVFVKLGIARRAGLREALPQHVGA